MRQNNEEANQKPETSIWSKEHDDYLITLVELYGEVDWQIITDCFNRKFEECKKLKKDCCNRWKLLLGASSRRLLWSDRERYLLLIAHQKYKNRWSEVARMLHKASRNLIKNRFYTLFRKIRNKVKNNDVHVSSSLDLLEMHYVLSLMEKYFDEPVEKTNEEKNYAHKLVLRMDKKKAINYKNKIMELYQNRGTIDDLFKECGRLFEKVGEEEPEDIEIQDEGMECNPIELNKEKVKIILPHPKSFERKRFMSTEEKDRFWRSAFINKEPKSAQVAYFPKCSIGSSFFSMAQSAGDIVKIYGVPRQDQGFRFPQFTNLLEGDDKKLATKYPNQLFLPSAISFNTHASSPFPPLGSAKSGELFY